MAANTSPKKDGHGKRAERVQVGACDVGVCRVRVVVLEQQLVRESENLDRGLTVVWSVPRCPVVDRMRHVSAEC